MASKTSNMMKKKQVTVVFDRLKRVKKNGKGLVEIKIYINRDQKKFIQVAEITEQEWPDYSESLELKQRVVYYESVLRAIETLNKPMTLDTVNESLGIESLKKKELPYERSQSFIAFFHDELDAEKIDLRTRKAREVVYRSLIAFGKIKKFADLTPANILEYHKWLQQGGQRTTTTLKHYHKRLHRYVIKAFEYGYIDRDPYKLVKIPAGQYEERKPLNEDEINILLSLRLPPKEEKARDLFIFSCFTGLAYCDAQLFDFHTMTEKEGDLYYIDGKRLKTGSRFYTPILDPAMQVLRKYNYRLPRMSNQKLNDYLHLVQSRACLNKKMTSHVARHTFATWVLAHDVPIENVTRMLGQKDVRTTQVYAKILPTTIQRHAETLNQSIKTRPAHVKAIPKPQTLPLSQPVVVMQPDNAYTYSYDCNPVIYISL